MKRVLITGANSYIGTSVEKWLRKNPENFDVQTVDMINGTWRKKDFSKYDVVYHVAGLAHADVGKVSEEKKAFYYKINTDLAIETAQKAKTEGVSQFILMSSMIIYDGCNQKMIDGNTEPCPSNFYGDSKWKADCGIRALQDETFKVVVLRPPMIYGKNSKGNYPTLAKLAKKLPIFPDFPNQRSMLHIDNLCEFVKLMIENEEEGVFWPQNAEYTRTAEMVKMIAAAHGKKIPLVKWMNPFVALALHMPGKIGGLSCKAFGNLTYAQAMSRYKEVYQIRNLQESIKLTET